MLGEFRRFMNEMLKGWVFKEFFSKNGTLGFSKNFRRCGYPF